MVATRMLLALVVAVAVRDVRAEVPCFDLEGCKEYYYYLGANWLLVWSTHTPLSTPLHAV